MRYVFALIKKQYLIAIIPKSFSPVFVFQLSIWAETQPSTDLAFLYDNFFYMDLAVHVVHCTNIKV